MVNNMHFSHSDLDNLDDRYRALLINSLSGFKSANLIGTADKQGNENLAIVSSVFHLGANPPLMGMIFRPHSVARHSLENMIETGFYTLNHVHEDIYQQAHQTSARYDKEQSEFNQTGLTAEYLNAFTAPFVKQSRVKIGLELQTTQTIELNQTELVIGKVVDLHIEQRAINTDGFVDIAALGSVAVSGLDCYHSTQKLGRLSYAKPNTTPSLIE